MKEQASKSSTVYQKSPSTENNNEPEPFLDDTSDFLNTSMVQKNESPFFTKTPSNPFFKPVKSRSLTPPVQKQSTEEEEVQMKEVPIQKKATPEQSQKENKTGLPNNLKTGIENLSGFSMDDVKVHRNSDKPTQLQAEAYAQGTDIHLGQGQEKHLPHEAWHVVQQKQGRVKPTVQMKDNVNINDDEELETEADIMGSKALQLNNNGRSSSAIIKTYHGSNAPIQRSVGFEMQSTWTIEKIGETKNPDSKAVAYSGMFFKIEVDAGDGKPELEIVTNPLSNRKEVDACMAEIRYVVNILVGLRKKANNKRTFNVPKGDGWVEDCTIKGGSIEPTFKLQYTEGVTLKKLPLLIKDLHSKAWEGLPAVLSEGLEEEEDLEPPTKKRKIEYKEPEETKVRGIFSTIMMYLDDAKAFKPKKKEDGPKYAFTLMARTDFHSMFQELDKKEKLQFNKDMKDLVYSVYGAKKQVFPGIKSIDLTVSEWIDSIIKGRIIDGKGTRVPKDEMSPPPTYDMHHEVDKYNEDNPDNQQMKYAMGMYEMDNDKVLFEARDVGSGMGDILDAAETRIYDLVDKTGTRDDEFENKKGGRRKKNKPMQPFDPFEEWRKDPEKAPEKTKKKRVKYGKDYFPTQTQINRMKAHQLVLHWIKPDGFCMVGALSVVTGRSKDEIIDTLINALTHEVNAQNWINEYTIYSVEEVKNVLSNLATNFNKPAADAIIGLACFVLDTSVTIIEPDGTPIEVQGGGRILIHVHNPVAHYHIADRKT
ncbi:eCIS core domain-containing protein [Aquimarina sp. 2304DJ70-9]|uniref:eCIS core domain-containing protein n=1 Tax=Aquimarina penaris TaxID=3231044 RepID=UPI003462DC6A